MSNPVFPPRYRKQIANQNFWVYQLPGGTFYSRPKEGEVLPEGWAGVKQITATSLRNAKRFTRPLDGPPHDHPGMKVGRWVEVHLAMHFGLKEDTTQAVGYELCEDS